MKWNLIGTIAFLCTLFCIKADTALTELIENYQQEKNVFFASMLGGASHVTWVLSILDELSNRGHSITFVTSDIQEKFGRPYPHFKTIVIRKVDMTMLYKALDGKKPSMFRLLQTMIQSYTDNFEHDYNTFKTIMAENKIDVALCDLGGMAGCRDAALSSKIPYITTSSLSFSKDSSAPYVNNNPLMTRDSTTLHMSFTDRFIDMFVTPAKAFWFLRSKTRKMIETRRAMGLSDKHDLDPSVDRNNLKLVNSKFGFEAARPLGPLVEFVGPILPKKYESLTPKLSQFLSNHTRVIYVAFGQHASTSSENKELLLTAILEAIEEGAYDGFMWAVGRGLTDGFPESIRTNSGKIYKTKDILNEAYPNTIFLSWAPQIAVLVHPSVSVFLTHGGAGSFYEGLYGGKKLITFPFFGDQYMNAQKVERNKLGAFLHQDASQEEANDILVRVGRDTDKVLQQNVNRYKALVQIHSRHGSIRAADLIEEVMYASLDSLLPHRYEHSRYMSFIKGYNIDLFSAAFLSASISLSALFYGLKRTFNFFIRKADLKAPKLKENYLLFLFFLREHMIIILKIYVFTLIII
ncbi:hypothetical protein BD560DRAFT_390794 [Blakeslea trispora]|nr:hypothetical protein BD560DRAFT_390794 [Blakeslea trispora]